MVMTAEILEIVGLALTCLILVLVGQIKRCQGNKGIAGQTEQMLADAISKMEDRLGKRLERRNSRPVVEPPPTSISDEIDQAFNRLKGELS